MKDARIAPCGPLLPSRVLIQVSLRDGSEGAGSTFLALPPPFFERILSGCHATPKLIGSGPCLRECNVGIFAKGRTIKPACAAVTKAEAPRFYSGACDANGQAGAAQVGDLHTPPRGSESLHEGIRKRYAHVIRTRHRVPLGTHPGHKMSRLIPNIYGHV